MAFQINDNMLKNLNRVGDSASRMEAQQLFRIEYLALNKLVPSDKNFYRIENIDELAQDILINGLQQNIVVRKIGETDEYEIITGERRFTAYKKLWETKGDKYKLIPAKIVNVNDVDAEIQLIQSNAQTRTLSPAEILTQVERITALYKAKKDKGEPLGGRIKELVASDLGMGARQVQKYQNINTNLADELKEKISNGEVSINTATELIKLPKEQQLSEYNEQREKKNNPKKKIDIAVEEYSQPTGKPIKRNGFRYSYTCGGCGAELYSHSMLSVRCEDCDQLFVLGEQ